ncbi:MAG: methionine--tRNA ligase [Spirochaetaceae bacterium]|nr:methionine--tRNA ligase [Spirochaetaceae bacterium]
MNRRLITSALPYVNNIPHLGNLIQVLSADVFARFCRSKGYETVYVCGTDEYGTATETKALEEKKTPRELCDYYHAIHKDIYEWFNINFDYFGRTSTPQQTEIVQQLFLDLDKRGFIHEQTIEQLFCPTCDHFLADRYIRGICPYCGYDDARGDQCEKCGKLLEPTELQSPRCSTCGGTPEPRKTKHLYIDLPGIQAEYGKWMEKASVDGQWAKNAIQMTQAWIRDGLQERAITRDLKWGIPVPKEGFENKVFYVWFDAPIGYISITKALADSLQEKGIAFDWKAWWLPEEAVDTETTKNPVDLFQFIGKDNIPFHTVIFPSTLIGSGKNWTKLHHMSSTEYLNYESGKFSKSKGIGVFGSDAKESGIPADAWRFYIFYNRPEKSDTQFTWSDFQDKLNGELIGNLGNLVNRTTTFVSRYYDGKIPEGSSDETLWNAIREGEKKVTEAFEWANLRDAFHEIFAISDLANKAFQNGEPWKTRTTDPEKAAALIRDLCYVIKDLMIMVQPFMPSYAEEVLSFFGKHADSSKIGVERLENTLTWADLGCTEGLSTVTNAHIIFTTLDDAKTNDYRNKYAGSQKERKEKENAVKQSKKEEKPNADPVTIFNTKIALKIGKITKIEKHPDAEKLYVETIDDGSENPRVIVSGLVPYFTEEQLLGKTVVIADNLKARKMRGVESRGMLLAADCTGDDGAEIVEVLDCSWAKPGDLITLKAFEESIAKPESIDADTFFSVPITVKNHRVEINGIPLIVAGKEITTSVIKNGEVG